MGRRANEALLPYSPFKTAIGRSQARHEKRLSGWPCTTKRSKNLVVINLGGIRMDIIFNFTHYDRNLIRDQLEEWRFRGYAASLQNDEEVEINDGSKPFDEDLEPILI